jgi:hypothetical protein
VSVLQFLLDLSDRDAAGAVRCRIDFKYALGLDLDDPGFHHSVLGALTSTQAQATATTRDSRRQQCTRARSVDAHAFAARGLR